MAQHGHRQRRTRIQVEGPGSSFIASINVQTGFAVAHTARGLVSAPVVEGGVPLHAPARAQLEDRTTAFGVLLAPVQHVLEADAGRDPPGAGVAGDMPVEGFEVSLPVRVPGKQAFAEDFIDALIVQPARPPQTTRSVAPMSPDTQPPAWPKWISTAAEHATNRPGDAGPDPAASPGAHDHSAAIPAGTAAFGGAVGRQALWS